MKTRLNYLVITFLFCIPFSHSQSLIVNSENTSFRIKHGNFVQCIGLTSDSVKTYIFGKVEYIGKSGIQLKRNTFLGGSGGFMLYDNIQNIDKVNVIKRSLLPALVCGLIIGQLMFNSNAPEEIFPFIGTAATYLIIVNAIKINKRKLKRNQVGRTVFLELSD